MNLKYTIKSEIMSLHRKIQWSCSQYLQFKIQNTKRNPIAFHDGSTYDYNFIINNLAKEFYGQLEWLGENTEKYITFSVPISKKLGNGKKIMYRLKVSDSFRFMSTLLSSL